MPYVKPEARMMLNIGGPPSGPGELNYVLTELALRYINLRSHSGPSYAAINDAIGALECAKLELYRRLAAPYEDLKIKENGDVYPTQGR